MIQPVQVNDIVLIKAYDDDPVNRLGRVSAIKDGKYRVTNMNQPFQGVVNDWFTRDEIESQTPLVGG